MKYKVWVEIEEFDDKTKISREVSTYPVLVGEFSSLEEADQAVIGLTGDSSLGLYEIN